MSDSDSDDDSSTDGVGAILPIQQEDVRRIVSGQVINDMSSAVKELVDNALDAGATSINVRLFNQGLDVIEVSDDGSGVPKHSRPLLAMKHATSKIMNFDDLYKDEVIDGKLQPHKLGFRGEALFSLVQISQNLIVCTRTEDEEMAQQMQFNRDGYLDPNSVQDVARKVGTTVAVVKLFDKLPVRRADMIKRLKAQKAKVIRLMQAYAVLCVGVRINVYEKSGQGYSKTNVLMSTSEKSRIIQETISSVFGSSFLSGLTKFKVDLSPIVEKSLCANTNENSKSDHTTLAQSKNIWRVEGMVSNAPNSNRQSVATEIQFFSVNGRPVDLPKLSKVVSDVWRNFESAELAKKRAACIIAVHLPNSMFDVNVSPDKREVFFSNESEICNLVREGLFELWSSQVGGAFIRNSAMQGQSADRFSRYEKDAQDEKLSSEKPSCELYPPDNEKIEASNHMNNTSRRRMKRRNAFLRDPESAGKLTTDAYAEVANTASSNNDNYFAEETAQAQSKKSFANNINGDTNLKKRKLPRNDDVNDYAYSSQQAKIRQNEAMEKRIWNQTKLNFVHAESVNQVEEIRKLKSLQSQGNKAAESSNDEEKVERNVDGKTNGEEVEKVPSRPQDRPSPCFIAYETDVSLKSTGISYNSPSSSVSAISNIQSKTDSQGTHDSLRSPIVSQQLSKEKEIDNQTSYSESNCTNDTDIGKGINPNVEEQVRSPQIPNEASKRRKTANSPTSNFELLSKAAIEVTPGTLTDAWSPSLESKHANKQPQEKGHIVWNSFQNTDDVAEKAKSMYIDIMNRRQRLKEIQQSKNNKMNDLNNSIAGTSNHNNVSNDKGKVVKLSKGDFLTMKIIGQFNLGFILALSESGELWILDQHACDEQFNFERLCIETKIHEQKLLKPLPLHELSPSEENCILTNLEIFEQNGFKFAYDESKPPRCRLSLTHLPHSGSGGDGRKAVQFGKEDVGALCALLGADGASSSAVAGSGTGADGGGSMGNNAVRRHAGLGSGAIIRLPKSIAMFASRACRSSIMIGDALTEKKMGEIVKRLNVVDSPWTCPHGRPTIRHIKDLLDDFINDEIKSSRAVAGEIAALSQDEYEGGES